MKGKNRYTLVHGETRDIAGEECGDAPMLGIDVSIARAEARLRREYAPFRNDDRCACPPFYPP